MPDLFAHFAVTYLPTRYSRLQPDGVLFIAGSLLPDLVSRFFQVALDRILDLGTEYFFAAFHTPVGFGLICYVLAMLFQEPMRRRAFWHLFAGCLLHFVLDLMQGQFYEAAYQPFFPFSLEKVQWGWFHYDASLYLFPIFFVAVFWFLLKKPVPAHRDSSQGGAGSADEI